MSYTNAPFPYDIGNLLGGAVAVYYAVADGGSPIAVPADLADVHALSSPYAPVTGWNRIGATKDAFSYSRGFETSGWEIQNIAGNVIEEITGLSRSIKVSVAEFKPELLQLIEGAPAANTSTVNGQLVTKYGSFKSLNRYRFAFVAQRSIQSGVVDEGSIERGRFFAGVAYSAQIAADEVTWDQAKGELTAAEVTFTMFPQSGQAAGQEWGAYFDEQAGAVATG